MNTPMLVKQPRPKPFRVLDRRDGRLYYCSKLFTAPPCWPFPAGGLESYSTNVGIGHTT